MAIAVKTAAMGLVKAKRDCTRPTANRAAAKASNTGISGKNSSSPTARSHACERNPAAAKNSITARVATALDRVIYATGTTPKNHAAMRLGLSTGTW